MEFEDVVISFRAEFYAEFNGIIHFLISSKLNDLFVIQQYKIIVQ